MHRFGLVHEKLLLKLGKSNAEGAKIRGLSLEEAKGC